MAAPSLRDELVAIKVELARLDEQLQREAHSRGNLKTAVGLLEEESRHSALSLQELRLQGESLAKRVTDLEERLRTVSAQRWALLATIIMAAATVAAAWLH